MYLNESVEHENLCAKSLDTILNKGRRKGIKIDHNNFKENRVDSKMPFLELPAEKEKSKNILVISPRKKPAQVSLKTHETNANVEKDFSKTQDTTNTSILGNRKSLTPNEKPARHVRSYTFPQPTKLRSDKLDKNHQQLLKAKKVASQAIKVIIEISVELIYFLFILHKLIKSCQFCLFYLVQELLKKIIQFWFQNSKRRSYEV